VEGGLLVEVYEMLGMDEHEERDRLRQVAQRY
jgi:hypothetical protein